MGIFWRCLRTQVKSSVENLDPADWMRDIRQQRPGTHKLSSLTIPGTHNSFARVGYVEASPVYPDFVREFAECQTYGIREQLLMGVRYIDLRTSGTDLHLRHGRIGLKGYLREALDVIAEFLQQHSDETVLVQAKRDMESLTGDRHGETPETRRAVEDAFSSYSCSYTETREPSLDECRGKMVLLSTDHATKGINLSPSRDGSPNINWDYANEEKHWEDVARRLEWNANNGSTDDGCWYHCGCNSYWFPPGNVISNLVAIKNHNYRTPRDHSKYLSWRMSELIKNKYWDKRYRLGVVELDFAYPTLVKQLLLTNFN
ncbi:PLC-like phosphodiesterase [Lindgomyces ingoldianus]|uniref:PLC-like phosphodiesterase n=1 Tax=Lindgomyces ingoldianus TaxID=673940 RepID=A0ACB6QLC3_9PLEO|nr:PLC-like phosphodiesterase [Lindgomyces ingoldianus]KAF2467769.1 PLC-like phosphodiesterase [Lindgomyces ingoldianus]